jgi:hypothetical protein
MNVHTISRRSGLLATGIMLPLAIAAVAAASAQDAQQSAPESVEEIVAEVVEQDTEETIDEITVYGDKPLYALRREVYRAETDFFELFSALNDDKEYDVRCYYEIPSFTHIRRHVCRAQFVVDATSAEAEMYRTEGPRRPMVRAASTIQRKEKQLQKLMETLVAEHPELLHALNRYTEAKQTLESEKDRRTAKED